MEQDIANRDCEFCKIAARQAKAVVVHESPDTLAFFPRRPAAKGHVLVIPKAHVSDLWHIPSNYLQTVMKSVSLVAQGLRIALAPDGINLINSTGKAASQTVFHFHMHLVPRWENDGFADLWLSSHSIREEEADALARKIENGITERIGMIGKSTCAQ
ncbi:HIT family protein [Embleya sp. NPDC127516]|uniref:HIT family protein n=1 Tax=Embleya sp. NPDC127516 TaxID=3363990 RepID=UPI00382CC6C3